MQTLTLYRGDTIQIEEFSFNKTKSQCLVGKGIYLTNSVAIAETYRTKGAYQYHKNYNPRNHEDKVLIHGLEFPNKPAALEKAVYSFAMDIYRERTGKSHCIRKGKYPDFTFEDTPEFLQFIQKVARPEFNQHLEDDNIVVTSSPGNHRLRLFKVVLINRKKREIGKLSRFEFPEPFFSRNVLVTNEVERYVMDLIWENQIHNKAVKYDCVADFLSREFSHDWNGWKFYQQNKFKLDYYSINWNKLRSILVPYGIIGYEYEGGGMTGGTRHRAFSIWDQDFVNKHRVA